MELIFGLLAMAIIIRLLGNYLVNRIKYKKRNNYHQEIDLSEEEITDYHNKYERKLLLTKNEWYEYKKLTELATNKGYQICPKVRLLDLIEPRRGEPKYKTLFYKIQSKHVDFVICDQNLYVKAILELDDNSHNQADRKERDEFVDLILKDVGYTVIRTRGITDTTLDILEKEKAPT